MTGDLVDHPAPYFFGGFPVDQVTTLETLATLEATTIVPGHGDVLQLTRHTSSAHRLVESSERRCRKRSEQRKDPGRSAGIASKTFDVKS